MQYNTSIGLLCARVSHEVENSSKPGLVHLKKGQYSVKIGMALNFIYYRCFAVCAIFTKLTAEQFKIIVWRFYYGCLI